MFVANHPQESRIEMKPKPMAPMPQMTPSPKDKTWWPEDLGTPGVTGSSNGTRYAYFADKHRLAVKAEGPVRLYDTGDRRLSGFGTHGDGRLRFESNTGPCELKSLRPI